MANGKLSGMVVLVAGLLAILAMLLIVSLADVPASLNLAKSSDFGSNPQTGAFLTEAQAGREQVLSAASAVLSAAPGYSPSSIPTIREAASSLAVTTKQAAMSLRDTEAFGVENVEKAEIESAYSAVIASAASLAHVTSDSTATSDMAQLDTALSQMTVIEEVP